MKKRLIELIQSAPKTDTVYGDIKLPYPIHTANLTADHLLANGVIVPPCRIGDRVWHIRRTPEYEGGSYVVEAEVVYITAHIWKIGSNIELNVQYTNRDGVFECAKSVFGKLSFLTREEAERALAERKKV